MTRESVDVLADVIAGTLWQLRVARDVLVRHEAEREVDAARSKARDARWQIQIVLVIDALDAVQQIIFPARTREDLQRVVFEPLRAHGRRVGLTAAHELKPRALA